MAVSTISRALDNDDVSRAGALLDVLWSEEEERQWQRAQAEFDAGILEMKVALQMDDVLTRKYMATRLFRPERFIARVKKSQGEYARQVIQTYIARGLDASPSNKTLEAAARIGDLDLLDTVVRRRDAGHLERAELDAALVEACGSGSAKVAARLLDLAAADRADQHRSIPISEVAADALRATMKSHADEGAPAVLRLLHAHGVDFSSKQAFLAACRSSRLVLQTFVDLRGAPLPSEWFSPAMLAATDACRPKPDTIELIIRLFGGDLSPLSDDDVHALLVRACAFRGSPEVARLLVHCGADAHRDNEAALATTVHNLWRKDFLRVAENPAVRVLIDEFHACPTAALTTAIDLDSIVDEDAEYFNIDDEGMACTKVMVSLALVALGARITPSVLNAAERFDLRHAPACDGDAIVAETLRTLEEMYEDPTTQRHLALAGCHWLVKLGQGHDSPEDVRCALSVAWDVEFDA